MVMKPSATLIDHIYTNNLMNIRNKEIMYRPNLKKKANRKYFSQLVNDKTSVSSIWKALHIFTHKNRSYNTSAVNIPPGSLNDHFLSLPSRLLQSFM